MSRKKRENYNVKCQMSRKKREVVFSERAKVGEYV